MAWPYTFPDSTPEEKHLRRILLDRYALYAQLSCLIPILGFQLYRLGAWVHAERRRARGDYSAIPGSPALKQARNGRLGTLVKTWRAGLWWLEGEVAPGWGLRAYWAAGGLWTSWLLFLCIHQTGDDYLHLTKRFGVVAASQFPIHYMLSMKSLYSPLAFVFRSSHEELNAWHRISGRIIILLLLLHGGFYTNFFIQKGILLTRTTELVVVIGITALSMLLTVGTSSLAIVRRWNYRVFFIIHLVIGITLMPLLFFHAKPLRFFVAEALGLFLIDIVLRKVDTITEFAKITRVPHTKLLKITLPVPAAKLARFRAAPGQHVYLSIPVKSAPPTKSSPYIYEYVFNPFTVASVSATDITLVVRALHGPSTTALDKYSKLSKAKPPLNIEGPYGTSRKFPNFVDEFDRILLVAGGVGATFILPIYQSLRQSLDADSVTSDKLTFIWSMRSAAESTWALDPDERSILDTDENVKVFVTRSRSDVRDHSREPVPEDGSVELDELSRVDEPIKFSGGRERPDLKKFVEEVFSHGKEERVAVLVCGPAAMARDLRGHIGKWVEKGRDVWWHDEAFGW